MIFKRPYAARVYAGVARLRATEYCLYAGVDSRRRGEQIELLNIRQETHEEYALSRPAGLREALLIVASFLLFFFCLITPDVFVPWMIGGAILLLAAGLWGFCAAVEKRAAEIHCLRERPPLGTVWGE